MSSNPTFEIGLVMAGAVSAGAYSAGVMDFLIEALDAYEDAKRQPGWTGPTHDVKIPVLAGASAGGMTAALAALHVFHDFEHVRHGQPAPAPKNNRLYSTWVSEISIERLLDTRDLDGSGVRSLLCSAVLDDILKAAFDLPGAIRQRPWIGGATSPGLTLILTLTNLRGVPYSIELSGDQRNARYGMLNHRDSLEFTVGVGAPRANSGGHWLDIAQVAGPGWDLFKKAALATGAFPGALAPRLLARPITDYTESNRCDEISPDRSDEWPETYECICVDGGVMDNEPFELARRRLAGGPGLSNPRGGDEACRAVVLVDPFPNAPGLPQPSADDSLFSVASSLLGALKDQARFKPEELRLAASDRVFSRFIIAPARDAAPHADAAPIASASLGAFGGFLHESFRRHDYLLGRRNAQDFLRSRFALPESNTLFDGFNDREARQQWWVREAAPESGGREPSLKYVYAKAEGVSDAKERALPIIPLVERLRAPIVISGDDLPQPHRLDLNRLRVCVRRRADALYAALLASGGLGAAKLSPLRRRLGRGVGAAAWRTLGRDYVVETIISRFENAQQDVAAAFRPPIKR